ncbi:MAG: recombinase family protein [Aristaeellaceae bacterium]
MARKKKVEIPMEAAVIYARYSSHMQNDASIEQQVAECKVYAEENNLRIIGIYEDRAMSGRSDKRPEFQKMMRAAEDRKFQVVLAYKSNRISRNMLHALAYEDKLSRFGIRVVYAKEEFGNNAAGRFALRTMMNVNQFYSENMAEDIRRGLMDGAMQCRVVSALPLGYKKGADGKYEIDASTAPIVREVFQRVLSGEMMASIADDLNARGIRTKLGKPWGRSSFHRLLTNERYIGVYIYNTVRIEDGVPPIIDKEVFYAVQDIVKKKATPIKGRRRENGEYLLTGKLFCGYCKSPMVGISGTSRTGELHYYYVCQKRHTEKACHKKNVRRDWIERMVAEALKMYVLQDETIEWVADMVLEYAKKFREEDTQIDYLQTKLDESKKASANIMRAIEAGIFNSQTQERMLELEAEQRDLSAQLIAEKALVPNVEREQIVYWMQSFRNGNVENSAFRAKLFDAFLVAVYLYDDRIKLAFDWDKDKKTIEVPIETWGDSDTYTDDIPGECVRIESPESHAQIRTDYRFGFFLASPTPIKALKSTDFGAFLYPFLLENRRSKKMCYVQKRCSALSEHLFVCNSSFDQQ